MKYLIYDMGQLKRGQRVQVTLSGNAANVRLMDSSNYSSYKAGRSHKYHKANVVILTSIIRNNI